MKKILAVCLIAVMVMAMSVSVFADPGGFVRSPSVNSASTVVGFESVDKTCAGKLVITPYKERAKLPDDLRTLIEKAYDEIAKSKDLTKLNAGLAELAANKKLKGEQLAVSDLFDLRVTGCDSHENHVNFNVTIASDSLNRFVGLLHMDKDGKWELLSDAEVTNNGENLKFSVKRFSPFAIVVQSAPASVKTGDNSMVPVYIIIMAVSAIALLAIVVIKNRKQKA